MVMSTLLTLVVIPVLYFLAEAARERIRGKRPAEAPAPVDDGAAVESA